MTNRVYLDWNATTPLRPEARAVMAAAWDLCGNPSSVHAEGRQARRLVEAARRAVAAAVNGDPANVVFTSGGTEANVMALEPRPRNGGGGERLLVSAIEHPSVLAGGRFPIGRVETVAVSSAGIVDLDDLRTKLATGAPPLVSVMLANNETGAIQPVGAIADLVRAAGGVLHVDAIQAFGKIDVDLKKLKADLMSLSAHKIGGPKGVGALIYKTEAVGTEAIFQGGGQEQGRRAGTENVAGIAGFGAAVAVSSAGILAVAEHVGTLRNRLEEGLRATPGLTIVCDAVDRLPNTTLFTLKGLRAETAVIALDLAGIAVSSGSACSSGKVQPSHVLAAMGFPSEVAGSAIRMSLGWTTTEADIERSLEAWRKLANTLLKQSDETVLERF